MRTSVHLVRVDLGVSTDRVLAANIALRDRTYPDDAARVAFFERLLPRLADAPGVEAVGLANWPVVSPPRPQPLEVEGSPASAPSAAVVAISPGYFEALGMTVVEGRAFAAADRLGAERVAVVSETLARRLVADGRAVGSRIRVVSRSPGVAPVAEWSTIVGVVSDVRQGPADEDRSDVYVPLLQSPTRFAPLYARSAGSAMSSLTALRAALREIDPEASMALIGTLDQLFDDQLARPRFLAGLLSAFAGFAVLLSLVGVDRVIAYAVRQREQESPCAWRSVPMRAR